MSKKAELKLISNQDPDKKKAIVFIHGLSGHELKTWRKKGSLSIPELFSNDNDLSDYDIFSFGYRTGFFLKQYNVEEISRLLVTEMKNRLHDKHSIYLITHSQGGLIARQMILTLLDRGMKDQTERIKGVVYLAVPFGGATAGTLMKWVASCIPNIFGEWLFSVQVLSLAIFSKELSTLRERWNLNLIKGTLSNLQEKAVIGLKDQTVNPSFSARPDYITNLEEVDEHHRSICKFDSDHMLYNSIKQFITIPKMKEDKNIEVEQEKQMASTADEYFSKRDYKNALKEYIQLVGKIKSLEMMVYIKQQQGQCHFHLARETNDKRERYLNNSKNEFLEAIQLAGEDYSYSLFTNLGDVYFQLSAIRNPVKYLKKSREAQGKALEKCDKLKFLNEYLDILNKMAITYLDMAEHENVKENVDQAIIIFNKILIEDEVLESLAWEISNNIGRCYEKLGRVSREEVAEKYFLNAIDYYNKALNIVNIMDNPNDYMLCRNNLGNAYVLLSQIRDGFEEVDKALECYNEVYEISKRDTQSFEYCWVLNNLGNTYFQFYDKRKTKDDLLKAIDFYKKSLEHKEISVRPIMYGRTKLNYGISLLHLAEMENNEENLNAAINSFKWSIKLSPNSNSYQYQAAHSKLSKALIEKSLLTKEAKYIYQAINDLSLLIEETKGFYFNSNNLHSSFFNHMEYAYSSLAKVEKEKSNLIQQLERGIQFFINFNYKIGIASLNKLLGIVYCSLYNESDFYDSTLLTSMIKHFHTSVINYKELQKPYSQSVVFYLLAATYKEFYDQENEIEYLMEARKNGGEALKHIQQLLDDNEDMRYHELHTEIQKLLSNVNKNDNISE